MASLLSNRAFKPPFPTSNMTFSPSIKLERKASFPPSSSPSSVQGTLEVGKGGLPPEKRAIEERGQPFPTSNMPPSLVSH